MSETVVDNRIVVPQHYRDGINRGDQAVIERFKEMGYDILLRSGRARWATEADTLPIRQILEHQSDWDMAWFRGDFDSGPGDGTD